MHRHKVVARIFLLLTIASFTFAGHVQALKMHKMRVDLVTEAKNVMQGSEMRHTQLEELLELLGRASTAGHLHSRVDPIPAQASNTGDLEGEKFFNKKLNRKIKEYIVLGAISGVFSGIGSGIQMEIVGSVTPGAYVLFFSPPFPHLPTLEWRGSQTYSDYGIFLSSTVGRSVERSNELPQDQKDPVSRSLSKMRNEDLQMLSIISRRILNSLD